MFRKMTLALAAAATLCLGAVSATPASAGWHGHHRHHHGHHGGWGWLARPYYGFAAYPAYYGCYRTVHVTTPWGPRLRRIWVCG